MSIECIVTHDIDKSVSDKKDYRLVSYNDTQLEVLLVSTKALHGDNIVHAKSAAACSINVGSLADPKGIAEGCAHYIEHMIFMGSEKYPGENDYDSFITSHGGFDNAFTEQDCTVYYFDISTEFLEPALDIFAHCFIDPLLPVGSLERELLAIDSEFCLAVNSDQSRAEQLFCSCARATHAINKFSWGSKKSLKSVPNKRGINMKSLLQSFHQFYYKPNNSKVVVISPKELDEIQKDVEASFAPWIRPTANSDEPVKKSTKLSKKEKKIVFSTMEELMNAPLNDQPLDPSKLGVICRCIPIKEKHMLSLSWTFPSSLETYKSKSCRYISHLLGHEGPGSLLAALKRENLAITCATGGKEYPSPMFSTFSIEMVLTSKGLSNWITVAQIVFNYLDMLRVNGPKQWIYEELAELAKIDFAYVEEGEESDFVEQLAELMVDTKKIDRKDLLTSRYYYWDYRPDEISEILSRFVPYTCRISIYSPFYKDSNDSNEDGSSDDDNDDEDEDEDDDDSEEGDDDSEEGDDDDEDNEDDDEDMASENGAVASLLPEDVIKQYTGPEKWLELVLPPKDTRAPCIEKYFNIKYWEDTIPSDLYEFFATPYFHNVNILRLPSPNPYIPKELSVLPCSNDQSVTDLYETANKYPTKLICDDGLSVWHAKDTQFAMPKVSIAMKFASKVSHQSVENAVLHELMVNMLKEELNEELYTASMAELHGKVQNKSSHHCIFLSVYGFNDKASNLIETMYDAVLNPERYIQVSSFYREVERLTLSYRNAINSVANATRTARLVTLLPTSEYLPSQMLQYLDTVSLEFLQSYVSDFLHQMCIDVYFHGNITSSKVNDFANTLKMRLGCNERIHLSRGFHPNEKIQRIPSNVVSILQILPTNIQEKNSCVEVYYQCGMYSFDDIVPLDILTQCLSEPFFHDLRTTQQLGYDVSCSSRLSHGVLGFLFKVTSSSHSLIDVRRAIFTFVEAVPVLIQQLSEEKYQSNIDAVRLDYLKPQPNLSSIASFNWQNGIDDIKYSFDDKVKCAQVLENYTINSNGKEKVLEFYQNYFLGELKRVLVVQSARQLEEPIDSVDGTLKFINCDTFHGCECYIEYPN